MSASIVLRDLMLSRVISIVLSVFLLVADLQGQSTVWVCMSPGAYAYHVSSGCNLLNRCTYNISTMAIAEAQKMGRSQCRRCPPLVEHTDTSWDEEVVPEQNDSLGDVVDISSVDSQQEIELWARIDSLIRLTDAQKAVIQDVQLRTSNHQALLVELQRAMGRQDSTLAAISKQLLQLNAALERKRLLRRSLRFTLRWM